MKPREGNKDGKNETRAQTWAA